MYMAETRLPSALMSSYHPSLRTKLLYGFGSVAYGVKDNGFSFLLLLYYNQVLGLPERWVGAGPSATTLRSKDKGNPLGVIYPEDGTLLMISPSGVLKNAPAPNAGKLYLEFLMNKEAAEIEVKQRGESIVKGVKPLPGARSLEHVKTVRPSLEEIQKGIPEVKELFRDTFGI